MPKRTKRGCVKTLAVLEKLKNGRSGAIQVRTEAKINSPEYRAAGAVLDTIDGLAEELTGHRKVFGEAAHNIGHSINDRTNYPFLAHNSAS